MINYTTKIDICQGKKHIFLCKITFLMTDKKGVKPKKDFTPCYVNSREAPAAEASILFD